MNDGRWADSPHLNWSGDGALFTLAVGVCSGVSFLHEFRDEDGSPAPILHRDLKPENVLVEGKKAGPPNEWEAKVGDFGESKQARQETMTMVGTRE